MTATKPKRKQSRKTERKNEAPTLEKALVSDDAAEALRMIADAAPDVRAMLVYESSSGAGSQSMEELLIGIGMDTLLDLYNNHSVSASGMVRAALTLASATLEARRKTTADYLDEAKASARRQVAAIERTIRPEKEVCDDQA